MNTLCEFIAPIFYKLLFMSVTAVIIGIIIIGIMHIADKRISPFWKKAIWLCVLLSLVLPIRFQSAVSPSNDIQQLENISYREEYSSAQEHYNNLVDHYSTDEKTTSINPEIKDEYYEYYVKSEITEAKKEVDKLQIKSLIFDKILPLIWLSGMIIIAIIMIISRIKIISKLKNNTISDKFYHILDKCKLETEVTQKIKIIISDWVKTPALIGTLSPKIILPQYALEMEEKELRYVILHETVHIKLRDTVLNDLMLILGTVYWFNPIIRLFFKYIRQDMELANDEYVLKVIGESEKNSYSRALVNVLGMASGLKLIPKMPDIAISMTDSKSNIERRIKMMKLSDNFKKNRVLIGIISILLISTLCFLFFTVKPMLAEEPENTPIAEDVSTTSATTTTPTTTTAVTTTAITEPPKPLEFTNAEAENLYNLIWDNMSVWEREEMEGATLLDVDFDGTPEFLLRHMNTLSIFKFEDSNFKEFFILSECNGNIALYTDGSGKKSWVLQYTPERTDKRWESRVSLFDFTGGEITEFVKYADVQTGENINTAMGEMQYFIDEKEFTATKAQELEFEKGKEDGTLEWWWQGYNMPTAYYWQKEYLNFIEVILNDTAYRISPNTDSWYPSEGAWYVIVPNPNGDLYLTEPCDENVIKQSLCTLANAYTTNDTEYLMAPFVHSYGSAGKPVIYLYPEETTDIDVKVTFPDGHFTCTYPDYGDGWSVTAYPDGTVINKADGLEYSYLYWEGEGAFNWDFSSGFVVKGSDTAKFLREKLSYMGLTPREYNEFIVYWLPLMQNNEYNLISFQTDAYTDNAVLDVSPKPDSLLRVFMAYKSLETPVNIPEQILKPFERKGFTVVEWGGTCAD